MLPSAGQQNGLPWPDGRASISQWTIAESFDDTKDCEATLAHHRKNFQQAYSKLSQKTPDAEFWGGFTRPQPEKPRVSQPTTHV
jgi:hypothetical protein